MGAGPNTSRFSWEEAVEHLRQDPAHHALIFESYLTADLVDNCRRFEASAEFAAVRALLREVVPTARDVLDIPGGNGIATWALARAGYMLTTVEPDPSATVGRGAIMAVSEVAGLAARIVDARGESLPFPPESFDVIYVRQGLHHADNLARMVGECARLLRPGGILVACREHVVDNYGPSLKKFLDSQVDHQLYGGEQAFTLADYRAAIIGAGLALMREDGPYDSPINLHPLSLEDWRHSILNSRPGRLLSRVLPSGLVARIGMWWLKRRRIPGRLYTFLARKPGAG